MPSLSLDSMLALKCSFSPKASKLRIGGILEFFSGYDEALFIGVSLGLEMVLNCLNPIQVVVWIQTTFKTRLYSDSFFHLGYLLCESTHLILKVNMVISLLILWAFPSEIFLGLEGFPSLAIIGSGQE